MDTRFSTTVWTLALLVAWSAAAGAADIREEMTSFTSHDGFEIHCTLSYPAAKSGSFPGMLMIPGSGLHDADVTINEPTLEITRGEQKLFRPIARSFSRQGWAVQRCNKRGASFDHRHDQPQILESSTLEDLVQDARGALQALHDHPRVEARPLVVLGHSEGTMIATHLAQGRSDIDLLVLVGSVARGLDALIEYQLVDRNLAFLRHAADKNSDGILTLDELNRLDGNHGLGSVYVLNSAEILFSFTHQEDGSMETRGFNPETDSDGDGRLHITGEIEIALRAAAHRFLEMARDGSLGEYWRSMVEAGAPSSYIHRVRSPILFVHGALDVQTPVDEALALMARLEARNRTDYDVLLFPTLGHSLSKPNDFYKGDGGLTTLDNLTLDAAKQKTRRKLLQAIESALIP